MTRSETAAWAIYVARLQGIIDIQSQQFSEAQPRLPSITLAPPTREDVHIIQCAIDEAAKEATESTVSVALRPLIAAMDAIDNGDTRRGTVKAARAALQRAYDELHAVKRSESATAVGAEGRR